MVEFCRAVLAGDPRFHVELINADIHQDDDMRRHRIRGFDTCVTTSWEHILADNEPPNQSGETQLREILDCKKDLERTLRQAVPSFAYPHGDLAGDTFRAVQTAGCRIAVTVESRR